MECPVGGTVGPALTGKLLGVAGGTQEDFARAKPLLEQMCRRVDLVGPIGAGCQHEACDQSAAGDVLAKFR